MSKFISEQIAEILTYEFSDITVMTLISYCSENIGKSPKSLSKEDLPSFGKQLLQSIFLLSDTEKISRIKQKLQDLAH